MLDKAVSFALLHPHPQERALHAAIFVSCKNVEYVGYNRPKSHPFQKKFGKNEHSIFLHAEIDAILACIRAGDDPTGGKMYVARVLKKDGRPAISKPCKGCQKALFLYEIEVEHT